MGAFSGGALVLVQFPFSDLSQAKLRPAVVLAAAGRGDYVLCQVTSNAGADPRAVVLVQGDLVTGSLHRLSYARPGKLFTANDAIVVRQVGELTSDAKQRIIDEVIRLLRGR